MSMLVWLIVGALIGGIAARAVGAGTRQGVLLNLVVGIFGALVGGRLVWPMIAGDTLGGTPYELSTFAVVLACTGSVLVVANLIRRLARS